MIDVTKSSEQSGPTIDDSLARYSRQVLFDPIGEEGQRKLAASRVLLVGCGALGTAIANTLVRAGIGFLRICDRDFIERDNLQRQILFDEDDIVANLPKAEAAAAKLARVNSDVTVEAVVTDVIPTNIERLAADVDIILDGTDNFETRFLINDVAIKTGKPWVYGGVIGATGLCMTIIPGETPCLRCVFNETPPPELNPTCDTAGVIGPAVQVVAGLQTAEAMKLLVGRPEDVSRKLMHVDLWTGRFVGMNVDSARTDAECPCCTRREFSYLSGEHSTGATTLCGHNAVQIGSGATRKVDLAIIARKLDAVATGEVRHNQFMLKADVDGFELTLFPDGRAIIKGTVSEEKARSIYAKYLGM